MKQRGARAHACSVDTPVDATPDRIRHFQCNLLKYIQRATNKMAAKSPFSQGAQVEHPRFGLGSVTLNSEEHITIKFDEFGEKKFVSSIVLPNLKKSDREPPVAKRATRARKPKVVPAVAG